MIVWITSSGRSGNTFFRVVLHQLYGVNTYAAFQAAEVLVTAGAEALVGYQKLPVALQSAIISGNSGQIRVALDQLEASSEIYIFKTHAMAHELFGTNYRAILLVRDGRDALASYANYLVDIPFDSAAFAERRRRMAGSSSELLDGHAWIRLIKMLAVAGAKTLGLRRWMISRQIDRLLSEESPLYFDWGTGNRSWLEREPKPVVVYFEDLTRDPIGTVTHAVNSLNIGLKLKSGGSVPSFDELKQRYPSFFRRGTSGDWRNHFSPAQEELFWLKHEEMMKALKFCM